MTSKKINNLINATHNLTDFSSVYDPQEDSILLKQSIERLDIKRSARCLDVGTGSGILANALALFSDSVTAIDSNERAIQYCVKTQKEGVLNRNISFVHCDFFQLKKKQSEKQFGMFDLIVCNSPYLPDCDTDEHLAQALGGGKKGYEFCLRFLTHALSILALKGRIILLFSNKTNPDIVLQHAKKCLLTFNCLATQDVGFGEQIFVYEFSRLPGLDQAMNTHQLMNICYSAHGKTSVIAQAWMQNTHLEVQKTTLSQIQKTRNERKALKGERANYQIETQLDNQIETPLHNHTKIQLHNQLKTQLKRKRIKKRKTKVALKILENTARAVDTISTEAFYLQKANTVGIGPKYYFSFSAVLCMEFITGMALGKFLASPVEIISAKDKRNVCLTVLQQCFVLDCLGLQKNEMQFPYKNCLVKKKGKRYIPVLIDFERAQMSQRPKNVTQFCQYLQTLGYLENSEESCRTYKKNPSEQTFRAICSQIT